jgi:TIR domain-containing protein
VPGRNRFYAAGGSMLMEKAQGAAPGPCVFVSHKFDDLAIAVQIGRQLRELEVDVWLDVEDVSAQQAMRARSDDKLAEAIERGLTHCTHLLALISPRTKGSWWVPYEIGSGRGFGKELAFFVHRDVRELPAYLVFGKKILDQSDFYGWVATISSRRILTEAQARLQKSAARNPLADLLPPIRYG